MNYSVGQILYLLSHKSMKVFPVQVVEEVVRNTLKGKEISYTVMMPNKDGTLTPLANVNAEVFDNIEELKVFMTNNAIMTIENILSGARELESIFTPSLQQETEIAEKTKAIKKPLKEKNNVQKNNKESKIKVDVGNGIKANINVEDLAKLDLLR